MSNKSDADSYLDVIRRLTQALAQQERPIPKKFSEHAKNELEHRSEIITSLLDQFGEVFVSQLKTKEKFKKLFFWVVMSLLVIVLFVCGILVFRLTEEPLKGNIEGIAAFAAAIASGITALLGLPKIIADYLFNKEEDKSITTLLIEITKNDSSERHDLIEADRKEVLEDAKAALSKSKPT